MRLTCATRAIVLSQCFLHVFLFQPVPRLSLVPTASLACTSRYCCMVCIMYLRSAALSFLIASSIHPAHVHAPLIPSQPQQQQAPLPGSSPLAASMALAGAAAGAAPATAAVQGTLLLPVFRSGPFSTLPPPRSGHHALSFPCKLALLFFSAWLNAKTCSRSWGDHVGRQDLPCLCERGAIDRTFIVRASPRCSKLYLFSTPVPVSWGTVYAARGEQL